MRIFLDANILFTAAHKPTGNAASIIQYGTAKDSLSFYACDLALEQAKRNLISKHSTGLLELEKLLDKIEITATGHHFPCPIDLDEEDRIIFATAIHFQATHFLTGDIKDFGPYLNQPEKSAGILIQTVREFINRYREDLPFLNELRETRRKYKASLRQVVGANVKKGRS